MSAATPMPDGKAAEIVGGFLQALTGMLHEAGDHTWMEFCFRIEDQWKPLAAALEQLLAERAGGEPWVIWSWEHGGWWGPGECGYVRELGAAGVYARERALEIQARANQFRPAEAPNEIALALSSAPTFDPSVRRV